MIGINSPFLSPFNYLLQVRCQKTAAGAPATAAVRAVSAETEARTKRLPSTPPVKRLHRYPPASPSGTGLQHALPEVQWSAPDTCRIRNPPSCHLRRRLSNSSHCPHHHCPPRRARPFPSARLVRPRRAGASRKGECIIGSE